MRLPAARGTQCPVPRGLNRAGLLVLVGLASACAQETIAHQQNERSANRIIVLLSQSGIDSEKVRDLDSREIAFNITVPVEFKGSALEILERYNLPETRRDGTGDIFKEGGMIPTNTQERAKREVGVAGDIMNALRRVPRVVEASALVSIPEDNPLRDVNEAKPKPKASVIISYLPDGDNRPPLGVEDVQRFVQASLPELKTVEVSVQMIPSRRGAAMGSITNGSPTAGTVDGGTPAVAMANGCERERVMGIDVCAEHKKRLINSIIIVIALAGALSGMAVVAVFRALRYRKDLTRLTAQVQQLRK